MKFSLRKSLALVLLFLFFFTVVVIDGSHAAIVSITSNLGSRFFGADALIRSSFGGEYGLLNSFTDSFTVTTDTVADTASFTDMEFRVSVTGSDTRSKTNTMTTPPTDFPNPPIVNTATFTETVTFDAITPTNLAPQLVSSTVRAITYQRDFQYQFPSNVVIAFPNGFNVSGTYTMQGPTQMVTVPFNVQYTPFSSTNVTIPSRGFIYGGTSFSDTADIRALSRASVDYRPGNRTIFNGTVDGQQFSVNFVNTRIVAELPIPEPRSVCLYAVGITIFWGAIARRKRH